MRFSDHPVATAFALATLWLDLACKNHWMDMRRGRLSLIYTRVVSHKEWWRVFTCMLPGTPASTRTNPQPLIYWPMLLQLCMATTFLMQIEKRAFAGKSLNLVVMLAIAACLLAAPGHFIKTNTIFKLGKSGSDVFTTMLMTWFGFLAKDDAVNLFGLIDVRAILVVPLYLGYRYMATGKDQADLKLQLFAAGVGFVMFVLSVPSNQEEEEERKRRKEAAKASQRGRKQKAAAAAAAQDDDDDDENVAGGGAAGGTKKASATGSSVAAGSSTSSADKED